MEKEINNEYVGLKHLKIISIEYLIKTKKGERNEINKHGDDTIKRQ